MSTQAINNTNERDRQPASEVLSKGFCTGCSSCVSVCPRGALSFCKDEYGYYVPKVDFNICNRCGLCQKVCPALKFSQHKNHNKNNPELWIVKNADKSVLKCSSSGGAFSILAGEVIKNQGVVSGAAWTADFHVQHLIVDNYDDLALLRKSKYMQSFISDVFVKIESLLKQGRMVMFSGCPCQVAGLKLFLRKDYPGLITVDLLCANSPSSEFFQKYINETFDRKPVEYEFRSKKYGSWTSYASRVCFDDGTEVGINKADDLYQRAFHPHIMCPPHCEKCQFQTLPRVGDFTIGDFWGIRKKLPDLFVDDGVSAVLINSDKAEKFFDSVDKSIFDLKQKVPLEWLGGNGYALGGKSNYASQGRNRFYFGIKSGLSFKDALDSALKTPVCDDSLANAGNCVSFYNSAKVTDFKFDPAYWEEHHFFDSTYLFARFASSPSRKFAWRIFDKRLLSGHTYRFYVVFKVSTTSKIVNFHVMDTTTKHYKVIHRHTVGSSDSEKFVIKEFVFSADRNYDSFMIGASQIIGGDPWFAIQKLLVLEDDKVY